MNLINQLQRDIDEITEFGYCNYPETLKTLIEAKKRIEELERSKPKTGHNTLNNEVPN